MGCWLINLCDWSTRKSLGCFNHPSRGGYSIVKCCRRDSSWPLSPTGLFSCADVLCFDNSYSILQSKKVSYKVEVLPPPEGQVQAPHSRGQGRLQWWKRQCGAVDIIIVINIIRSCWQKQWSRADTEQPCAEEKGPVTVDKKSRQMPVYFSKIFGWNTSEGVRSEAPFKLRALLCFFFLKDVHFPCDQLLVTWFLFILCVHTLANQPQTDVQLFLSPRSCSKYWTTRWVIANFYRKFFNVLDGIIFFT